MVLKKPQETKNYTILLKREGEGNPWHCLLESFSMTLALDVLKISSNEENKPLITGEDAKNTQIVILTREKTVHSWISRPPRRRASFWLACKTIYISVPMA